jgi:hypothetical protein
MRTLTLVASFAALAACGNDVRLQRHSEPRLRRLLARQYANAVESLLGPDAASIAKAPSDIAAQGFDSIGASTLTPSDSSLAQYERSATAVAQKVVADISKVPALIGCTPSGVADAACFETMIKKLGKRAFRRTLTPDEVTRYVNVAMTTAGRYKNAYAGVAYAISALLQSPNFLYQVEIGEVDSDDGSRKKLTGTEIATRMAFFLTDHPPDEALIDMAEAGKLKSKEDIEKVALQLVESESAKGALDAFYTERFKLRELDTLAKDKTLFPNWKPELAQAMKQESLLLLRDVVWNQNADYRSMFTANYAFVNSDLATLYGVQPPTIAGAFEKRMLPPNRMGVFGQASFLAIEAHPGTTSPTRRGRFISERMLCTEIPPPPPNVVTELPDPMPGMPQTMRQRLAVHSTNPTCASCHVRMDNIGLALENFDAQGGFRQTDQGLQIDASGEVYGVAKFDGLAGLSQLVSTREELSRCWVRSLYRNATGHFEAEADEAALEDVDAKFTDANYRLKQVLVEIVTSDAFRFVDNAGGH